MTYRSLQSKGSCVLGTDAAVGYFLTSTAASANCPLLLLLVLMTFNISRNLCCYLFCSALC